MSGLDSEMWDREYQTEEESEAQLNGGSNTGDDTSERLTDIILSMGSQ